MMYRVSTELDVINHYRSLQSFFVATFKHLTKQPHQRCDIWAPVMRRRPCGYMFGNLRCDLNFKQKRSSFFFVPSSVFVCTLRLVPFSFRNVCRHERLTGVSAALGPLCVLRCRCLGAATKEHFAGGHFTIFLFSNSVLATARLNFRYLFSLLRAKKWGCRQSTLELNAGISRDVF